MLQAWTRMIKKASSIIYFLSALAFSAKQWIPNPVQSQSPKLQPTRAGKMQKPFVFLFLHLLLIGAMPGFLPFVARAQKAEPGIMNFQAIKSGKSILIRFTVPAGLSCDGIIIRRSVEGGDFLPIREIEGICGSDSASTTFSEEDKLPVFNRRMQYLLQLSRSAYSDTLNAFFTETGPAAYLLIRQADVWKILLNNSSGELIRFFAWDLRGAPVLSLETRGDFFKIPEISRFAGPLFFRLLHSKSGMLGVGKLPCIQ
jgi:hypothetical protein